MIVAQMLKGKSVGVITVAPSDPVVKAAKLLAEHKIGAVVVSADGTSIAGILSERDIVRELAARGAAVLDAPVRDLMTVKVITCRLNDSINEIMAMMSQGRFRHLPVAEHGALVGIISIGDVVKARVAEIENEANALRAYINA
jgi:CBS domain-containing protein